MMDWSWVQTGVIFGALCAFSRIVVTKLSRIVELLEVLVGVVQ
jgi:hypothetical protein